jgi:atypical dual specificity phosphatase
MALYEVHDGALHALGRSILSGVELDLPERTILVVMGPGGVGKTSLLQALSGRVLPAGLTLSGSWRHQGLPRQRWGDDVYLSSQRQAAGTVLDLDGIFAGLATTLLLDEPCRKVGAAALIDLAARLRAHRSRGAAIVVTHNLTFAHAVGDLACLIAGGRVQALCEADTFFDRPPTPLIARFLEDGSCWPATPLPSSFRWLAKGQIAGMAQPGLLREVTVDLSAIAAAGVTHVLSLTEDAPDMALLAAHGLHALHFPVADMAAPAPEPALALARMLAGIIDEGGAVAVHCRAGLGRTGTMLAVYLVARGVGPDEAIRAVRAVRRTYIQTREQESLVHRVAASLARDSGRAA